MEDSKNTKVEKRGIFNEDGDIELAKRRIIQGNTTNLNDFNNLKYSYTMDWYRQAMNNFWIPEEININQDINDYKNLTEAERYALDRVISSFASLDSIQTANLPNLQVYVTANEINLCLSIVTFQETIHSEAYSHILDTITDKDTSRQILYKWKKDERLNQRNETIAGLYRDFMFGDDELSFVKALITNYAVEGLLFYTGFAYIYQLELDGKMRGVSSVIRHIHRDEDNHLWLFRNIINDLRKERADLFSNDQLAEYTAMLKRAVEAEIDFASHILADESLAVNLADLESYLKYLGNQRAKGLGLEQLYAGYNEIPASMAYIEEMADPNQTKPSAVEEKVSGISNNSFLVDDL